MTAIDEWYARYANYQDTASVSVWMPTSLPHARLQVTERGSQEAPVLPKGPPIAYVVVGGVSFGGYLADMELMFRAVLEQLADVRAYADELESGESDQANAGNPSY